MNRDTALNLLRGGNDGIVKWNRCIDAEEEMPDLSGTNLSEADLSGANLSGANLSGANLSDAYAAKAKFNKANLAGANLNEARFNEANLAEVDLTRANLRDAELVRVVLTHANLCEADFCKADLYKANLQSANLMGSQFVLAKLAETDLRNAKLTCANFNDADLRSADLGDAKLVGADFTRANLCGANLTSAICDGAKFIGTHGLYGRYQVKADRLQGAEKATYTKWWDVPTWARIRNVGSLPLFGVSYLGIISISVWVASIKLVNHYLQALRVNQHTEGVKWIKSISDMPLPEHMGFTLFALVILAVATTLYKLFCPTEIQESSETRWAYELKQPIIVYRGLACSRKIARWVTAICYIVGGPWVLYLLGRRVWETLGILLFSI